jgi:hypothetical protein
MRPNNRTAFKTPPGLCTLCVGQPEPRHFNIFPQRHENVQRNEVYLHSCFNNAINTIFGQLQAPAALLSGTNTLYKSLYES